MGLKKGTTNNPNGRPKGSMNKTAGPMRNRISEFLTTNFDNIMHDLTCLPRVERVKAYTYMLQYGLPKLQAVALRAQIGDGKEGDDQEPITKHQIVRTVVFKNYGEDDSINITSLPPDLQLPLLAYLKEQGKASIKIIDDIDYSKLSDKFLEELVSSRDNSIHS